MASFLAEIKRRKVFHVAAVYAVVAWLTIQIVDVIGEPLHLPDWLDTVVIILLAVGFPIAVILAWAMSLTRGDVPYCLVLIWAFIGIAVKNGDTPVVATAAWAAAGFSVIGVIAGIVLNHRKRKTVSGEQALT